MINLKTIKKATEQEAIAIAKKQYANNDSMQNYLLDEYDFYVTQDEQIFEVRKTGKLPINKTIWYDDEKDAPKNHIDNFLYYNSNNSGHYDSFLESKNEMRKFYFCQNNKNISYIDYEQYGEIRGNVIRQITAEELDDILAIYKEQKENYIERLKKYYAKYGKKISISGYWANR
jgi:hypothetical protein